MSDTTEIHLDLLVVQIRNAADKNDNKELIEILEMCDRLLTDKQLARLKYLVKQEKSNG